MARFPSYESLRRVFARELAISPAAYQRRFATVRGGESEWKLCQVPNTCLNKQGVIGE